MEILIDIVSFSLFFGLILCPIILLRKIKKSKIKFKFITYLMVGIFLTAILTFLFAWWNYSSDLILLKHYGYDIEGMNETEFYGKVLPENMEKVKSIETSIMGIGWPLKAIMTFIFYLPYLIIIYIIYYLIEKNRRKKITYTSEI